MRRSKYHSRDVLFYVAHWRTCIQNKQKRTSSRWQIPTDPQVAFSPFPWRSSEAVSWLSSGDRNALAGSLSPPCSSMSALPCSGCPATSFLTPCWLLWAPGSSHQLLGSHIATRLHCRLLALINSAAQRKSTRPNPQRWLNETLEYQGSNVWSPNTTPDDSTKHMEQGLPRHGPRDLQDCVGSRWVTKTAHFMQLEDLAELESSMW